MRVLSNDLLARERERKREAMNLSLEERNTKAMDLLERVLPMLEHSAPDKTWFKDFFALTGEHAILTDEGWQTDVTRDDFENDEILDEVNAPALAQAD